MVAETKISRSSDPCTYHSSWPASLILTSSCSLSCALFCKLHFSLLPTGWVPASIVLSGTICYSTWELHKAIAALSKENQSSVLVACPSELWLWLWPWGSDLEVTGANCSLRRHRVLFSWGFSHFNQRLTIWRNLSFCNPHFEKDLWSQGYWLFHHYGSVLYKYCCSFMLQFNYCFKFLLACL